MTIEFILGNRSKANLIGVHKDLVKVVKRALVISEIDFAVIEGVRTLSRQRELFEIGASNTIQSRHLTGHAIDLAAYVGGTIRWDWPLYYKIADAMKKAANEKDIALEWGGDWLTMRDGPHFQLAWGIYPAESVIA